MHATELLARGYSSSHIDVLAAQILTGCLRAIDSSASARRGPTNGGLERSAPSKAMATRSRRHTTGRRLILRRGKQARCARASCSQLFFATATASAAIGTARTRPLLNVFFLPGAGLPPCRHSPKREPGKFGQHFKVDDARVWQRLHFLAMRTTGMYQTSPSFCAYYEKFLGKAAARSLCCASAVRFSL